MPWHEILGYLALAFAALKAYAYANRMALAEAAVDAALVIDPAIPDDQVEAATRKAVGDLRPSLPALLSEEVVALVLSAHRRIVAAGKPATS